MLGIKDMGSCLKDSGIAQKARRSDPDRPRVSVWGLGLSVWCSAFRDEDSELRAVFVRLMHAGGSTKGSCLRLIDLCIHHSRLESDKEEEEEEEAQPTQISSASSS